VPGIELVDLAAAWSGSGNVFTGLTAEAGPGRWLAVTGASGSGKSTLLAAILGFLPAASGHLYVSGRAAWCPQEAHLFDSTIRGNLLLARPEPEPVPEPAPAGTDGVAAGSGDAARGGKAAAAGDDEQMRAALDAVGLGPLLARLEDGLDTRIGPGGAFLSGGERTRLAVARTLMTGADVILLDEPTAHLDAESGRLMLAELRDGLRDRTVVLVTHNPNDIDTADTRLDMDAAAAAAAAGEGPAPAAVLARG
jgi:ATP-binding cassette subfamily C protein CydCD